MNSKILLLSIAVISVGLFAMPSTLSLFAGQHTFDAGSAVKCEKCHQNVYDALSTGNTIHESIKGAGAECDGCHRVDTITNIPVGNGTLGSVTTNGSSGGTNVNLSHTKVMTLECVVCHWAVSNNITNSAEAHKPYYDSAVADAILPLKGGNAACIGCHTHSVMTIQWSMPGGYNLNANVSATGTWSLTFLVNTTNTTNRTTSY